MSVLSAHKALSFIFDFLQEHPATNIYLVGGAVRNLLLHRVRPFDFDFVVQGMEPTLLETWLCERGELNLVGQHFGVYKFMPRGFSLKDLPFIDIALPRTEAVGQGSLGGYKDFDIQSDPNLPIEDDLARRDFTINAIAFDVRTQRLIDPFNGGGDLRQKLLRAVGMPQERFTEDLSRLLRGIRIASELEFHIEEATSTAIKKLLPKINSQRNVGDKLEYVVPREVVGMELAKTLSRNPGRGALELSFHGALAEFFPEIQDQLGQNRSYLDPLKTAAAGELTVVLAILLRALDKAGVQKALSYAGLDTLERGSPERIEVEHVTFLIELLQKNLGPKDIQNLRASEFEHAFINGRGLLFLRCADLLKRPDLAQAIRTRRKAIENRWLVDQNETIAPLLSGQDILAQGISPGPEVRTWLCSVRDLQLDGALMRREDALEWLKQQLQRL